MIRNKFQKNTSDISKENSLLKQAIDRTIKQVWINHIQSDYKTYFLLMEDTLKNALYFHIRKQLTDEFLEENRIRIFTEYRYNDSVADIAIVQFCESPGNQDHLRDDVESVLAIIEIKYKRAGNEKPFEDDVRKVERYIKNEPEGHTQFYLAFVHEIEYEFIDGSWLTKSQQKWAQGRVTELSGHYMGDEMVWQVLSHNNMNTDFFTDL